MWPLPALCGRCDRCRFPCAGAEDEARKTAALRHVVLYLVLAPYDNEQSDLTHRLLRDKALELIPTYK